MPTTATIRAAMSDDIDAIRSLAINNGMFEPDSMGDFDEMMSGYLDDSLADHAWVVAEDGTGQVVGAAYYAPEPFADRLWNLYFLAVRPGQHRDGSGTALISHVEQTLRQLGETRARILIVETSSLDAYAQARAFYRKHDYDEEARIRDFYGPGDNKVVFWKSLTGAT